MKHKWPQGYYVTHRKTLQLDNVCLILLGYREGRIGWRNIRKKFENGTPKLLEVSTVSTVSYHISLNKYCTK